ncbi:DUF342 domain-containing protein [Shewanella sp. NIFS-20-20]|uniref:DUF342 domain-containing protein n=1 Tax=Shewanella sp. NIFS-20-20 TaxID=2853806 RepID=UPI001C462A35|nr:FapA family protein [Shewanella sp. NIFS-20-20]MBV7314066.1 FapA family protein [Shewanella sp. NIFS-20-20]
MQADAQVHLSQNQQDLLLSIAADNHNDISAEQILQWLSTSPYKSFKPNIQSIEDGLHSRDLSFNMANTNPLSFCIANKLDAQCDFTISADKMSAMLDIITPYGGSGVDIKSILTGLKQRQIFMGISKLNIDKAIAQCQRLPSGSSISVQIARGKAPIHGQDAYLQRLLPLVRERLAQPRLNPDGSVDMRDLGELSSVTPGQLLMRKHPATFGENGYNIHGVTLYAKQGKDCAMIPGTGTELDPRNPLQILATQAGQLVETPNGIQVDNVLMLNGVDIAQGHVDFHGSLLIKGDVQEGMKVKATGNISILGFVENALIEAGGDICVHKGIVGRQERGQKLMTQLRAGGSISAQFAQYAALECMQDIMIASQLLHSHCRTPGCVYVHDKHKYKGELVGGVIEANRGIFAVNIGASAGSITRLSCGQGINQLRLQLKPIETQIQEIVLRQLALNNQIKRLPTKEACLANPNLLSKLKKMQQNRQQLATELLLAEQAAVNLQLQIEQYFEHHRVQAYKRLHVNAEITIDKATHRAICEHGPSVLRCVDGKISFDYQGLTN